MRRSVLASLLVFLPMTVSASGLRVVIEGRVTTFVDTPAEAWFAPYVRDAAEAGVVSGYRDAAGGLTGLFGPGDPVTVAQALKIAVEGAGFDETSYNPVQLGLHGTDWYVPYLAVAVAQNFRFFRDQQVDFGRPATRAEVAAMFVDAFNAETSATLEGTFRDVTATTPYGVSIEALARDGVITGDTDALGKLTGTFRPNDQINRAEVVKIVMKARQTYGAVPGGAMMPQLEEGWNIVRYTDSGFVPATLRVPVNTTVIFRNDSNRGMWVASTPHPAHTDYQGFDALTTFANGQQYSFKFTKAGSWGFHNHTQPGHLGNIVVQP